jgi:hypothetical protein
VTVFKDRLRGLPFSFYWLTCLILRFNRWHRLRNVAVTSPHFAGWATWQPISAVPVRSGLRFGCLVHFFHRFLVVRPKPLALFAMQSTDCHRLNKANDLLTAVNVHSSSFTPRSTELEMAAVEPPEKNSFQNSTLLIRIRRANDR